MSPGHPIILLKSNEFNMAAVSVKRSISARKEHLDVTTMFTYPHANTPLGQSERAYYLSYFINIKLYTEHRFPQDTHQLSTCEPGSS